MIQNQKQQYLSKLTRIFRQVNFVRNHSVELIDISQSSDRIYCLGCCYACWTRNTRTVPYPRWHGRTYEKYRNADLIIWSFRFIILAYLQNQSVSDRLLPINLPTIDIPLTTGQTDFPSRYDLSHQRHILISTCGFASSQKQLRQSVSTIWTYVPWQAD